MSAVFYHFFSVVALVISAPLVRCQDLQGDNIATGIATAVLGAIFPDIQQSQNQNSLLNSPPGGGLPQSAFSANSNLFRQFGSSPGQQQQQQQQRQARLNSPQELSGNGQTLPSNGLISPANLLNGIFGGPPSPPATKGFDRAGAFAPAFTGFTNPDNQNSFLYPTGLRGRTDLPPSYVYPFAQPGSLISPSSRNAGETFALGNDQLSNYPRSPVQNRVGDPQYLFTGTPPPSPLSLHPSLSPFLTSLFNPLKSLLPQNNETTSRKVDNGDQQQQDLLSEAYKKFGIGAPTEKPQTSDNSDQQPDLAEIYRKLSVIGGGASAQQRQRGVARKQPDYEQQVQLQQQQQQFRPLVNRVNSAGLYPIGQQQQLSDFGNAGQQLLPPVDWQTALNAQQQALFLQQQQQGQQPLLLQPQIFNQIFPQGAQPVQAGLGVPPEAFPATVRGVQNAGGRVSKQSSTDGQADNYGVECPQCSPIDMVKMSGPWVQIYGNPDAMRTIYTTISTLQGLYGDDTLEGGTQSVQPVCVGYQFSRPHTMLDKQTLLKGLESTVNLYYRDDSPNRQLHEVLGRFRQDPNNPKQTSLKLPGFSVPMCSVKVGPSSSTMYSYVILTETIGTNRCQSYHVLARDSEMFFRDNNRYVAEFLKSEVESGRAKPLSVLPHSELCQLQTFSQILQ